MWKKRRLYGSHRLQFSSKETSIQSGITKLMLQHLWSDPHEPSHEPTKGQYMKIASLYICYLPLHTIRSLLFQVGNESYTSYQAEREHPSIFFSQCRGRFRSFISHFCYNKAKKCNIILASECCVLLFHDYRPWCVGSTASKE
jgi:hypothetical protein